MKIIVIGGGVIGSTHAYEALKAGHQVIQIDRDETPRMASVRNFGLVWVSGRRSGVELNAAIRARQLWEEIRNQIPGMSFRANGSLTMAVNQQEVDVMQECIKKEDASDRQWKILDRSEVLKVNPAVKGKYLAALWCPLDATVEPGTVLHSLREHMMGNSRYIWRNNLNIVDVRWQGDSASAIAHNGEIFQGDVVILCPGADHSSLFKEQFDSAPIRRVRLQMMSTAPFDEVLTTSIADGDSMRYYPGYLVPSLDKLEPQHPVASKHHMQLLMVQRTDGTLTIGDTHEYSEPFDFKLDDSPYEYLYDVASDLLGKKLPPILKRWDGIYSQRTDNAVCDRKMITPNIISVTGPGGRGNTLAPAIAEETLAGLRI